jgi:superfamily I DNA/RNA helicase
VPWSTRCPHHELAELILDESGYTEMWQADRSPSAEGRLENLKELIRFMEEFDTLRGLPGARGAGDGRRPGRHRPPSR